VKSSLSYVRTDPFCRALLLVVAGTILACGGTEPSVGLTTPKVTSIAIAVPPVGGYSVERGYHVTATAVAKNAAGAVVSAPLAWRSSNDKIFTVDISGRIAGVDTGFAVLYATVLDVVSNQVTVRVTFVGPAKIDTIGFSAPAAVSPGATPDSIRAVVTDRAGGPVANARVSFAVTAGGGSISPLIATTTSRGIASAEWKLGSTAGINTATATVLGEDDKVNTLISANSVAFTLKSFAALAAVDGDAQTAQIRAKLAVNPSVKLIDSTGNPRAGVSVTFATTGGGRVASTTVATGANGIASPGAWTLGDATGDQTLVAKVELASLTLHATGTGTAVHYMPNAITAGTFATCGIGTDGLSSCFGEQPKVGDSTFVNRVAPTRTKSAVTFLSIVASPTSPGRFCGVSSAQAVLCWGVNALSDSAGVSFTALAPRAVTSPQAFSQVAPGLVHTCALATDQSAWCWGDNSASQLGDQTTKSRGAPAPVAGGFTFTALAAGYGHTCGLAVDGGVFCWGFNTNAQLGNGTTTNANSPVRVTGTQTFKQISAGQSFTCGLTTAGRAYCWGNLGTGSTAVTSARTYATAPDFTRISSGAFHTCALTADGTAYCWGDNSVGQLGDSTLVERAAPTAVSTKLKFTSISAGVGHTCGQTADRSVACWGVNKAGELGDSVATAPSRPTPRFIVLDVVP
jgi:alpha-tubulin suppressor-like RCC1 family protein